jgi:hypothetical protein
MRSVAIQSASGCNFARYSLDSPQTKRHAWGHAFITNKNLAGSPSMFIQAIICLATALSFVLAVTGQFWDWTTNTVFLNLFVVVRFFWKGERNLWSGSGGIR